MAPRYKILSLLSTFSLVSYVARTNISVAAKLMMPELKLTEIQMGQVFSSFMLGYAIFQIPAGMLGDALGPRFVLAAAALVWAVTSVATSMTPVASAFLFLIAIRFLLGAGEAATYPVAARAACNWFPKRELTFANSVMLAGMTVGCAFFPAVNAWVMSNYGWRPVFWISAVASAAIAIVWWLFAADGPEAQAPVKGTGGEAVKLSAILANANVWWLSISYFLDSYILFLYVFWLYLYLVDVRGFSILKGGIFTGLPYLFAMVMMPASGRLTDVLSARMGGLTARRIVAMSVLTGSAALMFAGAMTPSPYLAIFALSISAALLMSTEGPFWTMSADIGQGRAGMVGGVMNTAGNLGGVVSTALVPILVRDYGWLFALGSGAVLAILAAATWLLLRDPRVSPADYPQST